jgi:hypothetical protein
VTLSREQTHERYGLRRIEVQPCAAPHDWKAYLRLSGAPRWFTGGLVKVARERGADPREWYVSFAPIGIEHWIAVERWTGTDWVADEDGCAAIEQYRQEAAGAVARHGHARSVG